MFAALVSTSRFGRGRWPDEPASRLPGRDTSAWAMYLFLASLVMFFLPLLVLYVRFRILAGTWPMPGAPSLTAGFLLATGILVCVSLSLHMAVASIQHDARRELILWSALGLTLGVAFVVCQTVNWAAFFASDIPVGAWNVAGFFYFFTAIHALHVIGGVAPLVFVTSNALRGRYTRTRHRGVKNCVLYWHFLDVVWLVMMAAFFLPLSA